MNNVKRCFACKGLKSLVSLGGLKKKCKECNGIGYIERNEDDVDELLEQSYKSVGVSPETIYKSKKKGAKIILKDGA